MKCWYYHQKTRIDLCVYIYSNQKRIEGKRQDKSFLIDYLTWKEKENIDMYVPRTDKLIISFQGQIFGWEIEVFFPVNLFD